MGYRINSKTGTKFRQWATTTLRQHITQGYTINPARIEKNYDAFMKAVEDVKKLLPEESSIPADDVLELVKAFASTWFSLDAYDRESLPTQGVNKKQVEVTATELTHAIAGLKSDLLDRGEATEIFAQEKNPNAIEGILGNIFQSFDGDDLYPTLEEKSAHLLYFMVKNHPFVDGNKRSGAFAFVWFLHKTGVLGVSKVTPETLTALTLFIAESDPKDKDRMVGLVILLLQSTNQ